MRTTDSPISDTRVSSPVLREVEQLSLSQRAASSIREAILSGKLSPGTQLVEAEIAEQLKISRAPVREALRFLEEEGLITRIPYKGAFVARLSREDILEVYSLRSAIEGLSAKLATERATPKDITRLQTIVNQMLGAAQAGELEQVTALDLQFHRAVCEISGHKLLLQVWRVLEQKVSLILAMRHRLHPEISEVVYMHHPLLEAIRAHDGDAAAQCMVDHIVTSGEFVSRDWSLVETHR